LVKLDIKADIIDFDDAGTTNNDDRDVIEITTTARVGYELVPGSTAFVETTYDFREFDTSIDDSGFKRSSRGVEVLLGGTLDISAVTFVELGVGYIKQTFDDQPLGRAKLGPTQGFSFKGSLIWNPTDLMTITGNIRRSVRETTLPGAASAFTSTFELKADYGLLEELLLSAGAKLNLESFDGISRSDELVKFELGAKYFIGRYFIANAKYTYEERFADQPGGSFVNNVLNFSLTARF
ncbi:outer membrane beta-barrel protein, partial [candidate division KSB1 bacterium]|nr:outer membrane beta-barrel protein [candidate division KSB1 bacterium]